MTDSELVEIMEDGGFMAYMEGIFPRPRLFHHADMCDASLGAVSRRKRGFYGHVDGIHPALLWHYRAYKASLRL